MLQTLVGVLLIVPSFYLLVKVASYRDGMGLLILWGIPLMMCVAGIAYCVGEAVLGLVK